MAAHASPRSPDAAPRTAAGLPLLAIVGRPNVGKSTLFNRVLGRRGAIVQDLPGTTRDRLYAETEWRGIPFRVVDTGGLLGEQLTGPYAGEVAAQVEHALSEADAVCLVVDAQAGPTPADADIAQLLRDAAQPVYVAANKADNARSPPRPPTSTRWGSATRGRSAPTTASPSRSCSTTSSTGCRPAPRPPPRRPAGSPSWAGPMSASHPSSTRSCRTSA